MTIAAAPAQVWEVLTDFPRYPEWSSFIQQVEGAAVTGTSLSVVIGRAGKKTWRSRPRVSAAEAPRRFGFQGHLGHPAIFATTHEFTLVAGAGGTEVVHSERFTGLVPALLRDPPGEGYRGFADFNAALKTRVEALAGA